MKLDLKGIAILAFIAGIVAFFLLAPAGGIKAAPAITLQTIDGQAIELEKLKGKPYLMVFWATDCPGCVKEIPHLVDLNQKLQGTGFRTIAVALPHDKEASIKAMRQLKGMQYDLVYDKTGEWSRAFGGIKVTPTSFLVNPDGKITRMQLGNFDFDQLEQQIRSMLKG
ncbi:peroxiredoxin family protein [Thiothrix subterranea]|uniref:TlpA disulfide reductase family protein n=1 Tax=Thiothrix subterranea TaxID=2735563 RepID=A0AA51MN38_9GAMM|nr:TlpA disulfide reductase family protein [Thiothrix subterranea]MDQ5768367.1 TlpA disulfide reductase family protein [Thiothrix subterranea]WML86955.1 TlpA disulfide reductase family protein [Thiothrix subterranea]